MRSLRLRWRLLTLLAVFALVVAACSSGDDAADETTTTAAAAAETTTTAAATAVAGGERLRAGHRWIGGEPKRPDRPPFPRVWPGAGCGTSDVSQESVSPCRCSSRNWLLTKRDQSYDDPP